MRFFAAHFFVVALACTLSGHAQVIEPSTSSQQQPVNEPGTPDAVPTTIFPHPDATRWLVSGQANIIFQAHPGFHSPYEGPHSLLARGEYKTSLVGTLFTGYELNPSPQNTTELLFDLESAGGRGISEALGLAGFTNLDVVRNPNLGSTPYVARIQLHQVIGLSHQLVAGARTPFSLPTQLPARRLELRAGRLSLPDFFDLNPVGSDSHLQFMNWTADNTGSYDYAADTRGYTYALYTEYDDKAVSVRAAVALMPTVANGIHLDWNLRRARGENFELDLNQAPLARLFHRPGTLRLISFLNYGDMGVYANANRNALLQLAAGNPFAIPDVAAHTPATTLKYGFALNTDQQLTSNIRAYSTLR